MSTNTYFQHYCYNIAKLKKYHMRYRLKTSCFFVHESLKEVIKKKSMKKKKAKLKDLR